MTKKPLPANGKRRYQRKDRRGQVQHSVRLSLRRNGKELVIMLTVDIIAQMGLAFGDLAHLDFDEKELEVVPATDGAFRVRKQTSHSGLWYPHLLIPIGPDKAFDCKFANQGSTIVEHQVDNRRLVLPLPGSIKLIMNEP
jgi:hypothetical protein